MKSLPRGNFRVGRPSEKDLINLIFPKIKFRQLSYGVASTASLSGTTTASATEAVTTQGHAIFNQIGAQQFYSYQHLPLKGYASLSTGQTLFTLTGLTTTNQNINDPTVWGQGVADPTTTIKGSYKSMFYNGGSTEHTFYNPGEVEVILDIWEVRPKTFNLSTETPLNTLCVDKVINAQNTTGLSNSISGAATTYLQPTDPSFTIEKSDHQFHDKFLSTVCKRVKILPGETIRHIVSHPPFKVTNTPWWKSKIYGQYASQISASTSDIDFAPFCTVWLLVRIHGSLVTTDPASQTYASLLANTAGTC